MPDAPNDLMPSSVTTFTGSAFHYTTSEGLLGILQSGSLRASAASSLNDLAEVRQGWDLIRRILAGLPVSESVEMLQRFAQDPWRSQHEVFVLSASEEGDDANQWRLYADGGRGYAIELDCSVQLAAISDRPDPNPERGLGTAARNVASVSAWHRVIYREVEVEAALLELVQAVDAEDRRIQESAAPEDETDWRYDSLQTDAYEALSTVAHLIKSPGFSGEAEIRVVATFFWGEEHIRYRATAGGVSGFATLATSPSGDSSVVVRPSGDEPLVTALPVRSVRLGPLLRPEHENTVMAFLRAQGMSSVEVTASTIPLR